MDVTNIIWVEMYGGNSGDCGNGIVLTTITISAIVTPTYMEPQGELTQPTQYCTDWQIKPDLLWYQSLCPPLIINNSLVVVAVAVVLTLN